MMCVNLVCYFIHHNGKELGPVQPERGLHQSDPITPYLFIIGAEGISVCLQDLESRGLILGCKIARGAPTISHLFFVDDSYLFFRAKPHESLQIKHFLHVYESASGQLINFQNLEVSFNPNVKEHLKEEICAILEVSNTSQADNYLGLPALIGRKKKAVFSYVKERVWKRIQGWNKKILSRAGKELLLKTVVQAIPSYAMDAFLLPLTLCEELERMMNSFWWGRDLEKKKGICWTSWDNLCRYKKEGGLSFRNLHNFNLALIAKQTWRLLTCSNSLVARIYKARYYPGSSFLVAKTNSNPCLIWHSIMGHGCPRTDSNRSQEESGLRRKCENMG